MDLRGGPVGGVRGHVVGDGRRGLVVGGDDVSDLVLGVDPGKTGALAVLAPDGWLVDVIDMPPVNGAALGATVADLLGDFAPDTIRTAYVERVHSMPKQGVATTWTFAEGYGALLGALGALRIPVVHVAPQVWKKEQGVTSAKATSRQRACEVWPTESKRFARVKDDGRAEAALIAHYGIGMPS